MYRPQHPTKTSSLGEGEGKQLYIRRCIHISGNYLVHATTIAPPQPPPSPTQHSATTTTTPIYTLQPPPPPTPPTLLPNHHHHHHLINSPPQPPSSLRPHQLPSPTTIITTTIALLNLHQHHRQIFAVIKEGESESKKVFDTPDDLYKLGWNEQKLSSFLSMLNRGVQTLSQRNQDGLRKHVIKIYVYLYVDLMCVV